MLKTFLNIHTRQVAVRPPNTLVNAFNSLRISQNTQSSLIRKFHQNSENSEKYIPITSKSRAYELYKRPTRPDGEQLSRYSGIKRPRNMENTQETVKSIESVAAVEATAQDAPTQPALEPAVENRLEKKRPFEDSTQPRKKGRTGAGEMQKSRKQRSKAVATLDATLVKDCADLRKRFNIKDEDIKPQGERFSLLTVTVDCLSAQGEGLAVSEAKDRVYVVPFALPGEEVEVKLCRTVEDITFTDLVRVIKPSPKRDDKLVQCQYFGKCGGCQFQMMSYADQLEHKRGVIERAYKNFFHLAPSLLPKVEDIMPSPLEYQYRTKLTPHFQGPRRGGWKEDAPVPDIGFNNKAAPFVLDIEDCPIGTPAVREGMKETRAFVRENFRTRYKKGATLLLRENTIREPLTTTTDTPMEDSTGKIIETLNPKTAQLEKYLERKLCETDNNKIVTEYVGPWIFHNEAGSFFQNNNSILTNFTDYVRSKLLLPSTDSSAAPKYLVDAYCGSGLFSITCGTPFKKVLGVDISAPGISQARINGLENGFAPEKLEFVLGNAEKIFEKIDLPADDTSMIIDPPRKGCDELFLDQLLDFKPKRIVYISCNVHTQARDLDYILRDERGKGYRVDSLSGFDFFPQVCWI